MQVFPQSSRFKAWSQGALKAVPAFGLSCTLCWFVPSSFAQVANTNTNTNPNATTITNPVSNPYANAKPNRIKDNHQSPLATIMQTRIWADTPEPKDFVKDHRPPPSRLKFQPLTGTDPERPKLRTPAELKDLETELEAARFKADKKAGIKPTAAAAVQSKPKPAAVTE